MWRPSRKVRFAGCRRGRARSTVRGVRKARDPITRLRTAIDCLPARTREAMLEGVRTESIVVGAYTDGHGGICPMLAAHRHGGRTSFVSFARAWDAFARTKTIRRATEREVRTLENLLVASLAAEQETDLAAAIADYRRRRFPEIIVRRLRPPQDERTPSLKRAKVSSPTVS
jgi:hypothetical protein